MIKDNKETEIVIVNNNYEKMARRKKSIIDSNNAAVSTNKKIDKAQKVNMVAMPVAGILFTAVFCVLLWLKLNIVIGGIPEAVVKVVISVFIALAFFGVTSYTMYGYKSKTDAQRKSVRTVSEAINFVTFIKDKKIKSYSLTSHEDIPYETQKVYLSLVLEDKQGQEYKYSSMDKWDLVMLPIIFDVIIDAENTTVFLPYESSLDDEKIRDKIKGQINDELVGIEREEKEKIAKQLSMVIAEKDAVERVLIKNTETVASLKKDLAKAQESLDRVNAARESEQRGLFVQLEDHKKNSERLETSLKNTESLLAKANAHESELQNTVSDLEKRLKESKAAAETELQNAVNSLEKQLKDSQTAAETSIREVREKYVGEIQTIKEEHEKENAELEASKKQEEIRGAEAAERADKAESQVAKLTEKIAKYEDESKKSIEAHEKLEKELDAAKQALATNADALRQRYDAQIKQMSEQADAAGKRHAEEIKNLKAQFAAAAKEAKDALVKKHTEEVDSLHAEIQKLAEESNVEAMVAELNETKAALKKATMSLTAREKELAFEREKINTLEIKLKESETKTDEKISGVLSEKAGFEKQLEEQKAIYEKAKAEKESAIAAAKMQERSLVKERDQLLEKIKKLESKIAGMGDYSALVSENKALKDRINEIRNEDIEEVKKECEEKISSAKKEKANMEKRMREALETAAKEKAERIKGETILRKYLSEKEQEEYEKKMAKQEAELAKAREMAEKAKQDAMKATSGQEKKEESKKPGRHLVY